MEKKYEIKSSPKALSFIMLSWPRVVKEVYFNFNKVQHKNADKVRNHVLRESAAAT